MIGSHIAQIANEYFKKRFPYTPKYSYHESELNAIKKRYAKWHWITVLLALVFISVPTMIYSGIFYQISSIVAALFVHPPDVLFLPGYPIFLLPGLVLSLYTFGYPIEWVQRYFLGVDGYLIFEDYYNTKQQYDNRSATIWFQKLWRIPLVISLLLAFTTGIKVSPGKLTFRKLIDVMPHTYQYSEVKNITYFSFFMNNQGTETFYPHYKIVFNDNSSISTNWFFNDTISSFRFVSLLKKPVDTIRVDPD